MQKKENETYESFKILGIVGIGCRFGGILRQRIRRGGYFSNRRRLAQRVVAGAGWVWHCQ